MVAKLIYKDMANHALVPTSQFGGRNSSSTLDAGLTILHDIQMAHQTRLRSGILLFDIQGFFDNINHRRLIKIFADLGFTPELVSWCSSFLRDCTVKLKFNGKISDPFCYAQALGVVDVGSLSVELSWRIRVRSGRPSCRAFQGQNHGVRRGYRDSGEVRQSA